VVYWAFLGHMMRGSILDAMNFLKPPLHQFDFIKKFNPKKMQISNFCGFPEFRKTRIENFINSDYSNYSQEIANWNNSNFW